MFLCPEFTNGHFAFRFADRCTGSSLHWTEAGWRTEGKRHKRHKLTLGDVKAKDTKTRYVQLESLLHSLRASNTDVFYFEAEKINQTTIITECSKVKLTKTKLSRTTTQHTESD